MQNNRPIAFYSHKFNPAQCKYTTREQELLSIVETVKQYQNILLGYDIKVFTDHKSLLYSKQSSGRLMRWRLLLEEYKIEWQHIKGEHNIVADALSRLPIDDSMDDTEMEETNSPANIAYAVMRKKEVQETNFPMNPSLIARHQQKDVELQQK
jgi:RNase H-like domain found in reverse transcriptase